MYDNLTRTNLEFAYRKAEKRIAELEAQIEKMKCCENCIHYDKDLGCMEVLRNCQCLSEWELRR